MMSIGGLPKAARLHHNTGISPPGNLYPASYQMTTTIDASCRGSGKCPRRGPHTQSPRGLPRQQQCHPQGSHRPATSPEIPTGTSLPKTLEKDESQSRKVMDQGVPLVGPRRRTTNMRPQKKVPRTPRACQNIRHGLGAQSPDLTQDPEPRYNVERISAINLQD